MSVAEDDVEVDKPKKKPRKIHRMSRTDKAIAYLLLLGFVSIVLWPLTFFVIGPGEVGVLFRTLTVGTETRFVYPEGINIKWPWNRIYPYEVRIQKQDETVHGLAADGLRITSDISVLYYPKAENAGKLHRAIGPEYADRFVRPTAVEAVRSVIGKYDPHELYQVDMAGLEREVMETIQSNTQDLIIFDQVIIRRIELPKEINQAISRKLTEEQNALAYEYVLEQARKEAERKRIDAIGYQTFYSIVADALTPQLLTWRGIEATVELSKSNNSKIVIVGGGKDQLPLILGSDIANQPNLPAPAPVNPQRYRLPDFDTLPQLFPNAPTSETDTLQDQETQQRPNESTSGENTSGGNSSGESTTTGETTSASGKENTEKAQTGN
ncbi:Membrane protease subunit stomatin/prohibitin-like protein [Stappia aggregata IAM 12614]|uniref:Membrane protease subunit stomatin/prohibitin-like protein n=1 Tax=Roseibium aggregatum (strain ATCC 25650 / DSM 13394 / JCM 20685 / NBRC 16684 / NCIMB 2208 / IAM 12614 / B1) TaxID=384765 RepID=A0NTU1_ROSAI|nr:prohibitin family protein [Roseibium aggregatum]EAV43850.1 Membrane protease subunit stomatin/prohibitin-like protein [Stappia aggregata IAM 12614] [Roseibium aggregatum IAM 12614]